VAVGFLRAVKVAITDIPENQIYKKHEVSCYVGMTRDCTLHLEGSKTVEVTDTGVVVV
jgi:hypothetical protein